MSAQNDPAPAPVQPPPAPAPLAAEPIQDSLHMVVRLASPKDAQQLAETIAHNIDDLEKATISVKTVHFAHWFLLPDGITVVLVTVFDGDFHDYIKDFVNRIGDLFNALLQHVPEADRPPLPVQKFPDEFEAWVKAHDMPAIGHLIRAYPGSTMLDIRQALGLPNIP